MSDDDLERRLRHALTLRAAQVEPDPRTWQRVVERGRRGRRRALALAGGAAVLVLAVVVVAAVDATRPRVEYPAGQALPEAREAVPAPGAAPCGSAPLVLVLRSAAGALTASCADGTTADLSAGAGGADSPALSADGGRLAFARAGEVVVRDLRSGAERAVGAGSDPAFAPDGRLARVAAEGIVVTGPTGAELATIPLADRAAPPGARVVDLAWTPGGDRLTYGLVADGGAPSAVVADPATGAAAAVPAHELARGGAQVGSWPVGAASFVTVSRCCDALVERVSLALVGYRGTPAAGFQGPQHRALVDLTDLPGFAGDRPAGAYLARPAGRVRAEPVGAGTRWSPAPAPSFLVGDGSALWLLDTTGAAVFLADGVTAAAVNPAAFEGGALDADALLAQRGRAPGARPRVDPPLALETATSVPD